MNKMLYMVMLLASITGQSFAQDAWNQSNTDKTFTLPADFAHLHFSVDLGKGNSMQIDMRDAGDLNLFSNIDSILKSFLADLRPFKDSLADELPAKTIDYVIDRSQIRKIRVQIHPPTSSSFTISDHSVNALKLEQDTVNFLGKTILNAKYTLRKAFTDVRYYRVQFLVNNIADLNNYTDGRLNEKIAILTRNLNNGWRTASHKHAELKKDTSITANYAKGYISGGNYFNMRISVDLQNYKSYFVPSFSLAAGVILTSSGFFKRQLFLSWDPQFLFSSNPQGSLRLRRNDFLTFTFGHGPIEDKQPLKESRLLTIFSVAYLIHRDGEYFDKNTFRFGGGRLSLFEGKTKIEPVIYWHNLFKGVTPGLRWIQSF